MRYNMVQTSEGASTIVIVFDDGNVTSLTDAHPNFLRIGQALLAGEDPSEWLDGSSSRYIERLSDRVTIEDGVIHFDGDAVYDGLADTIARYHREGREADNLVRFMERLSANPSRRSREQLFTWTQAKNLTIDPEGYIVAFKGVYERHDDTDFVGEDGTPLFPLDQYPYCSSNAGHGIVDGIDIDGRLPMGVGAVLEIPRSEVMDDPAVPCSVGLHVGTHSYATAFAPVLVEVRFDPADVVSVPSDSGHQKLRCCRYEIVDIHDVDAGDDLSDYEPDSEWDEDEAMEAFMEFSEPTFVQRLINRIKSRNRG